MYTNIITQKLELTAHVPLGTEPVFVSKTLQKAKIIVNEDGTQASAATSEYFCCVLEVKSYSRPSP